MSSDRADMPADRSDGLPRSRGCQMSKNYLQQVFGPDLYHLCGKGSDPQFDGANWR